MVLVFALAAGLCLQMFVHTNQVIGRCKAKDRAVMVAQNTAEVWKLNRGDGQKCVETLGGQWDADEWQIGYDDNWQEIDCSDAEYLVRAVSVVTNDPNLGRADISVEMADGDCLFQISVAWQEGGNG